MERRWQSRAGERSGEMRVEEDASGFVAAGVMTRARAAGQSASAPFCTAVAPDIGCQASGLRLIFRAHAPNPRSGPQDPASAPPFAIARCACFLPLCPCPVRFRSPTFGEKASSVLHSSCHPPYLPLPLLRAGAASPPQLPLNPSFDSSTCYTSPHRRHGNRQAPPLHLPVRRR